MLPASSPSPSFPELPEELIMPFIKALDDKQRKQFYKVVRALYDKMLPIKSFNKMGGYFTGYWYIHEIIKPYGIDNNQLRVLTLIYYATDHGKRYTCFNELLSFLSSPSLYYNVMYKLSKKGYIIRSRIDPRKPGFKHGRGRTGKFIQLSPSGLQLLSSLINDLHQLIYSTHIEPYIKD